MPPRYGKDVDSKAAGKVEDLLNADSAAPVLNLSDKPWAAAHKGGDLLLGVSKVFAACFEQNAKIASLKNRRCLF